MSSISGFAPVAGEEQMREKMTNASGWKGTAAAATVGNLMALVVAEVSEWSLTPEVVAGMFLVGYCSHLTTKMVCDMATNLCYPEGSSSMSHRDVKQIN